MSTLAAYRAEKGVYLEGLAANVRRLREERGLSQGDLHFKAKIHRTELGKIEAGETEPRLMILHVLAVALEVTIDELISGLPVPKERKPPPKQAKREQ